MARAAKKQKTSHQRDNYVTPELAEATGPQFQVSTKPMHASSQVPKSKTTNKTARAKQREELANDKHYLDHKSWWHPRLNLRYAVAVDGKLGIWKSVGKEYKKFQTNLPNLTEPGSTDQGIKIGECVLVRGLAKEDEDSSDDEISYSWWYAQVLQIRAPDSEHVYLLVAWLYRPEDLNEGQQEYHAGNELIPSNDLAVIDAISVENLVVVKKWEPSVQHLVERAQANTDVDEGIRFGVWRQTVSVEGERQSCEPLEKYCVCDRVANPDELLIGCNHCRRWMHEDCIEKRALKDYQNGRLGKADNEGEAPVTTDLEATADVNEGDNDTIVLGSGATSTGAAEPSRKGLLNYLNPFGRLASPSKKEVTPPQEDKTKDETIITTPQRRGKKALAIRSPEPKVAKLISDSFVAEVIFDRAVPGTAPSVTIVRKDEHDVELAEVYTGALRCLFADCRKIINESAEAARFPEDEVP